MTDQSQHRFDDQPDDQTQKNEFEELDALLAEPSEGEAREAPTDAASSEDEFDDLGVLINRGNYQGLPGAPSTAIRPATICDRYSPRGMAP